MIKSASEIRSAARTALSGHWAEAAMFTFVCYLASWAYCHLCTSASRSRTLSLDNCYDSLWFVVVCEVIDHFEIQIRSIYISCAVLVVFRETLV